MRKEFESFFLDGKSVEDKELDLRAEEWTFSLYTVAHDQRSSYHGKCWFFTGYQIREELEYTECISIITDWSTLKCTKLSCNFPQQGEKKKNIIRSCEGNLLTYCAVCYSLYLVKF
jgi:hypothetical protein